MQSRLDDWIEHAVIAVLYVLHNTGNGIDISTHISQNVRDRLPAVRAVCNIVTAVIEAGLYLVGGIIIRVCKIKERVDVESICFASHIGNGRRFINIFRRTPEEEIGIFVTHEVYVETIVQQIAVFHRLMVSQVTAGTKPFVVTLFFISFVGKHIQSGRYVEVSDAAGM